MVLYFILPGWFFLFCFFTRNQYGSQLVKHQHCWVFPASFFSQYKNNVATTSGSQSFTFAAKQSANRCFPKHFRWEIGTIVLKLIGFMSTAKFRQFDSFSAFCIIWQATPAKEWWSSGCRQNAESLNIFHLYILPTLWWYKRWLKISNVPI